MSSFLDTFIKNSMAVQLREHNHEKMIVVVDEHPYITKRDQENIADDILSHNDVTLPDDFDWRWIVNNGEKRGKLSERIYEAIGGAYNESPNLKYYIKAASNHVISNPTIYVADIHFGGFTWRDGDFGDKDSCYKSGTSIADKRNGFLVNRGVAALRIWGTKGWDFSNTAIKRVKKNMDSYTGYGRCWAIPDEPIDGCVLLHNPYPSGFNIVKYGYILETIINKFFSLDNVYTTLWRNYDQSDESYMYMNSGGVAVVAPKNLEDLVPESYEHTIFAGKRIL